MLIHNIILMSLIIQCIYFNSISWLASALSIVCHEIRLDKNVKIVSITCFFIFNISKHKTGICSMYMLL